ncbi:hypothetical protein Tco_0297957, partial [Tanacetum coccineum]
VCPSQECTTSGYSHDYSSRQPKSTAAESAHLSAGSIRKSPHLVGSQPADPSPPEYRPTPV